ncbi:prealbumin-like fold domain-containing protein [Bifidobacterium dentium]|uniref:prealbumin-like fold domain-containing protein n=1 Tax=Bifidobacterium dentium TaxID=1689 RepID=UPI003D18401E
MNFADLVRNGRGITHYVLKETKAPEGYEINDTLVKLLITDNGIFADAGTEDNGVSTMTHIGTLNEVLKQFAANRDINRMLSDLKVTQLRCADEECVTNGSWSETIGSERGTIPALPLPGPMQRLLGARPYLPTTTARTREPSPSPSPRTTRKTATRIRPACSARS